MENTEVDKKSKDLAKWRDYYNANKFNYLKQRLMNRVKANVNVKYTTLLKYDMVNYYLDNCNETQLQAFNKQRDFYNTMNDVSNLQNQQEKKLESAIKTIMGVNANLNIKIVKNEPALEKIEEEVKTVYNLSTAIHDIKYNAVNKHNKPLKDTTKRNQLNYLYKLSQLLNCEDNFSVLKDKKSLDKINSVPKALKIQLINLINSIHRYSIEFKTMMEKDIVMYRKELEKVFKEKNKYNKKMRNNVVKLEWTKAVKLYKDFEKHYKVRLKEYKKTMYDTTKSELHNLFYELNQIYLLFSLYVLRPPLRGGDYMKVNIVSKEILPISDRREQGIVEADPITNEIENYYVPRLHAFIFQNYKTADLYHQVWFIQSSKTLPNYFGKRMKLINIILDSLVMFPRKYLLCKRDNSLYTSTAIFNLLSETINTKVTANIFRHSYITYQYETLKIKDRKKKKLARLMLHQPTTAENQYLQAV